MSGRAALALLPLLAIGCGSGLGPLPDPYQALVRVRPADRETLYAALRDAPRSDEERLRKLEALFQGVGCEDVERRSVLGVPLPNVICLLRGDVDERIVVGANLDRPSGSRGYVENWSGATLLPALYWALGNERRHHTFEFIGFSNATRRRVLSVYGTWNLGSKHYLRGQGSQLRGLAAMVNLIALGLGDTAVWADQSDPDLFLDLASVANAMSLPLRARNFDPFFYADAREFEMRGVPSITIHSYDHQSAEIISDPTRDDSPDRIDPDAYFSSYRLVAAYLAYLDQSLPARRAPRSDAERAAHEREAGESGPE